MLRRLPPSDPELLRPLSVRDYFGLSADQWAFGDCGAFSYAAEHDPAISVDRAIAVYELYDFDLGASVDHIPLPEIVGRNGKRRRIRAVQSVRDQAKSVLKRFNALEGPALYPRIIDTECRLQADQGQFILHGNVDVLAASTVGEGNAVEIWDYKGANKPSVGDPDYQRYVFQMQVYADLYRQKSGAAPSKAVLYFLNELAGDPAPTARPVNALLEVNLDPPSVAQALASFGQTVAQIEGCRATRIWPNPTVAPPEKTCSACDLRWNCSAAAGFGRNYQLIYP